MTPTAAIAVHKNECAELAAQAAAGSPLLLPDDSRSADESFSRLLLITNDADMIISDLRRGHDNIRCRGVRASSATSSSSAAARAAAVHRFRCGRHYVIWFFAYSTCTTAKRNRAARVPAAAASHQ